MGSTPWYYIFKAILKMGVLKEGDEVMCPANTYIASILAISAVTSGPFLLNPSWATYNIDADNTKKKQLLQKQRLSSSHLYGQCSNRPHRKNLQKHSLKFD